MCANLTKPPLIKGGGTRDGDESLQSHLRPRDGGIAPQPRDTSDDKSPLPPFNKGGLIPPSPRLCVILQISQSNAATPPFIKGGFGRISTRFSIFQLALRVKLT